MNRLYTYLTVILAITIVGVSFQSGFIQMSFTLNQGYIAQTLCVNQDKPEMHCNGKCYLKKQLKKAQDEQPTEQSQINNKPVISWAVTDFEELLPADNASLLNKEFNYSIYPSEGFLRGIDHPPAIA